MIVQHNMEAAFASRNLKITTDNKKDSVKKLSSGYRINSAKDDAAGLSISEKLRFQIRGLNRASNNAQDGVSLIQAAEGALEEVHSILDRCKELSVRAANDTNTEQDRQCMQEEINELITEIDRIADTTEFNTLNVFSRDGVSPDTMTSRACVNTVDVTWEFVGAGGLVDKVTSSPGNVENNFNSDQTAMALDIQEAAQKTVAQLRQNFPDLFQACTSGVQVGLKFYNIDGSGNTLASASLRLAATSDSTCMAYTMNVDISDFPPGNYDKAKLQSTVAHEMTHLVMYDTLTSGMLHGTSASYPQWFVEGMAQTSSGDGGWLSGKLNTSSTDADIKNYMSQLASMPYGAGYLATMYLGYAVNGGGTVNSAGIGAGLNKLLGDMAKGATLDQAIANHTTYAGLADFQNKFKSADQDSLKFAKDFLTAKDSGAGSLLGKLNIPETTLIRDLPPVPVPVPVPGSDYMINSDYQIYNNFMGAVFTLPPGFNDLNSGEALNLQVGSLSGQAVQIPRFDVSADAILGAALNVMSHEDAGAAIASVDTAIERVSSVRSYYGALQNRLEHVIAIDDNTAENSQAAESVLRDLDMAEEMVTYSKHNILEQAGTSMLAQANHTLDGVLELIS